MKEARMLASFAYWPRRELLVELIEELLATGTKLDLFLDSGAFTAASKEIELTPAKYAYWLEPLLPYARCFANLDVIGNADATYANQKHMEDRLGLSPLPVYHAATKFEHLDRLLADGYKYIALGGMANRMKRPPIQWLIKCFQLARECGAEYHGFGVSDAKLIKAFPWQSVDSSGWLSGERFAAVSLFDNRAGKFTRIKLEQKTIAQLFKGSAQARRVGVSLRELAKTRPGTRIERPQRLAMALINIESSAQMETFARKLHRDREFRLYFVVGNRLQFRDVAGAYQSMNAHDRKRSSIA